jgi:hypothetical protein
VISGLVGDLSRNSLSNAVAGPAVVKSRARTARIIRSIVILPLCDDIGILPYTGGALKGDQPCGLCIPAGPAFLRQDVVIEKNAGIG